MARHIDPGFDHAHHPEIAVGVTTGPIDGQGADRHTDGFGLQSGFQLTTPNAMTLIIAFFG
jgi:hypothetical protein